MTPLLLLALSAGMRSLTPLALVGRAGRRRSTADDDPVAAWLRRPAVRLGVQALAIAELVGDKLPAAPDRTVAPGLAARAVAGALAGAAVAPVGRRAGAAAVVALGAIAAASLTLDLRRRAMRRHGQFGTGLAEDAVALALALLAVRFANPQAGRRARAESAFLPITARPGRAPRSETTP